MTWNAHRPGQFAGRESLAERRALPITGIRQDAAKTYTGRDDTIQLGGFSMAAGQADEHERTMAFAEIALGQIKALRQPASPRNYEIWYAYATGYQPSLDQRINETLKQNDTLSEADLEPIDETFLSPRRLVLITFVCLQFPSWAGLRNTRKSCSHRNARSLANILSARAITFGASGICYKLRKEKDFRA
jgi:hypothetical protein